MQDLLFLLLLLCLNYQQVSAAAPVFHVPATGGSSESRAEDVMVGTNFYTTFASDADAHTVTYGITNQSPATPVFTIDPNSGNVPVPSGGFDAETAQTFTITFSAADLSDTVTEVLTLTITDVNDNVPTFSLGSYSADVLDTATSGTTVVTAAATDLDVTSSLSYSIPNGDASNTFTIDNNGVITVNTPANLMAGDSYTLTVRVTDTVTPVTTTATISVIGNPCNPNPCQNSGTCQVSGSSASCTCTSAYTGNTCQTAASSGGSGDSDDDDKKISDGAIAGIVVGVVAGVVLAAAAVYFACKKCKPSI